MSVVFVESPVLPFSILFLDSPFSLIFLMFGSWNRLLGDITFILCTFGLF